MVDHDPEHWPRARRETPCQPLRNELHHPVDEALYTKKALSNPFSQNTLKSFLTPASSPHPEEGGEEAKADMARDIELHALNTLKMKEDSLHPGSSYSTREPEYEDFHSPPLVDRIMDSFRRHPDSQFFAVDPLGRNEPSSRIHNGAHYYDLRQATLESAHTNLARKLKSRHLQMIAIGGSIGRTNPHGP